MKRRFIRIASVGVCVLSAVAALAACEDDGTPASPSVDASTDGAFAPDSSNPTGADANVEPTLDAGPGDSATDDSATGDASDASDSADAALDIDAAFQTPDGGGPGVYVVNGAAVIGYYLGGHTLADFDEDGKLDLAVSGRDVGNKDGAIIALGDGLGGFIYETTVVTEWAASDVVASDFNKDGHLDLLVYQVGTGSPSYVALGKGNGLFDAPKTVNLPNAPRVAPGDFNGDGYLDIGIPRTDAPFYALNDKNGGFSGAVNLGGNGGTFGMTAADVDGDGDIDLAWNAGPLHFGINNGAGTFTTVGQAIDKLGALGFGDLDGDGHPDIVSSVFDNGVHTVVIPTRQNGTYEPAVTYGFAGNGLPHLVDFDGDGKLDVVVARPNGAFNNDSTGVGSVYVAHGNGDGTLGLVSNYVVSGGKVISDIVLGDVNKNGKLDIVAYDQDGKVTTLLR